MAKAATVDRLVATETLKADPPRIDLSAPNPLDTINRSAVARALQMNVSSVSRILSHHRVPHIHTLKRLAAYLGLSLDDLYRLLYHTDPPRDKHRRA